MTTPKPSKEKEIKIREADLTILIDMCKATLFISGMQRMGFRYTEKQFLDALNRIIKIMGSREITLKK